MGGRTREGQERSEETNTRSIRDIEVTNQDKIMKDGGRKKRNVIFEKAKSSIRVRWFVKSAQSKRIMMRCN